MTPNLELQDVAQVAIGAVTCVVGWLCKLMYGWWNHREYTEQKCWYTWSDYGLEKIERGRVRFYRTGTIALKRERYDTWEVVNADGTATKASSAQRWWISSAKPPIGEKV